MDSFVPRGPGWTLIKTIQFTRARHGYHSAMQAVCIVARDYWILHTKLPSITSSETGRRACGDDTDETGLTGSRWQHCVIISVVFAVVVLRCGFQLPSDFWLCAVVVRRCKHRLAHQHHQQHLLWSSMKDAHVFHTLEHTAMQ